MDRIIFKVQSPLMDDESNFQKNKLESSKTRALPETDTGKSLW